MEPELRVDAALIAAAVKQEDPTLAFIPHGQQVPVLTSEAKVVVAFGGNRSGKSDIGAMRSIKRHLSQPNKKFWCCTEDEPLAIRVQMAKIHNLLPKKLKTPKPNQRNFYYNYTTHGGYTNNKFTLSNNTTVEFKFYSQDVKSFQGEDLDGIWFDEIPPKSHYDESTVRLWDRGGDVLVTATATQGITPWVREILTGASSLVHRYSPLTRRNLPVHQRNQAAQAEIFYLWTLDNPHIDHNAVMAKARLYSTSELELRLYGIPSNLQGLIYPSFSTAAHTRPTPPLPPPPTTMHLMCLDPHDRKPWCMGWYVYLPRAQTLYTIAEYPDRPIHDDDVAAHLSVSDYVRFIKLIETKLKWYGSHHIHRLIDPNKGNTPVVGDTITETIIQNLSRKNLFFVPAPDALLEGHIEVREHLSYDPSEPISDKNQPRLYIDPSCINHVYQMQNYEFGDHRSSATQEEKGPKEQPKAKNKDFPDLLRYTLLFLKNFSRGVSTVETNPRKNRKRSYL